MIDLYNYYNEVLKEKEKIELEKKELEKDPKVQEYIRTYKKYKQADKQYKQAYTLMKNHEYSECNHILIYSKEENGKREGRTYSHSGCIKCGLDDSTLYIEKPTFEESVMADYIRSQKSWIINGKQLNITCNLPIACGIYESIKEANPNITDEEAIKLFKLSLIDIYIERKEEETNDKDFTK